MDDHQGALEKRCRENYPVSVRNYELEMTLFRLAWEAGHAHGDEEVLSKYCDFAEAAQVAVNAIQSETR